MNHNYLMIFFTLILTENVSAQEGKVCFFANNNYTGKSVCAGQGQEVSDLKDEWSDKISSIFVPSGMIVTVYENNDFSGKALTFRDDVDLFSSRSWADLNNEISSFRVRSAACFYEQDNFLGESICLSGNEYIDLFNNTDRRRKQSHVLNPLNDQISSIKLPQNTQVTVYKNDNYSGDYFTLTDDYSAFDLQKIGMDYSISSIQVSQQEYFICDQYCVVKDRMIIPIQYAFGRYWSDERIGQKQTLVSFDLNDKGNYSIEIIGGGIFKIIGREAFFIHESRSHSSIFKLSNESDTLSMLSTFNGGYFEVQLIESIGEQVVYYYPLITYLFDVDNTNVRFFINNANKIDPLIINKIVLTAEKNQSREGRSLVGTTACWLIPLLNIYNYVIQGRCNQVDRFVTNAYDFFNGANNKILQVSGSSKPLPKLMTNEALSADVFLTELSTEPVGILTQINSDMNGKSLTVPASARACKVSMKDEVLPHLRFRRQLIPPCIDWTLNILTDFTLLFGDSLDSWNAENFGRVIARIIRSGDTGYAALDTATDARFIESVRTYIAENIDNIALLKTAFDFSQLSYSVYLHHNSLDFNVETPQVAQLLPQGRYELALQNFEFVATIPRIRQHNQWLEQPEMHFDIEIISGATEDTLAARQHVLPDIDEWRRRYREAAQTLKSATNIENIGNPNLYEGMDVVISASNLVSDVVQSWLITPRDDYIYVIVRLSGEVISITLAVDINEFDAGVAGSLTHPAYVLHPMAEGVIRGAGTAAIRALAGYLAKKGKRALVSDVISQPSAIVKKKAGFQFINEL
ncbi:peptidase inhibitor family I36 protein [Yersinia intermedia]|uniref:peptidase inhibitor family I36 protein n=1 Tax=Yersinia intermedia TaxID=631 RepID=UPI0011A0BA80|nr:peptidase inhibitor family I36 protein [Yersinia intermedia]